MNKSFVAITKCPKCGEKIKVKALRCSKCGAMIPVHS